MSGDGRDLVCGFFFFGSATEQSRGLTEEEALNGERAEGDGGLCSANKTLQVVLVQENIQQCCRVIWCDFITLIRQRFVNDTFFFNPFIVAFNVVERP